MDMLCAVPQALQAAYRGYSDYQRGKQMRLGSYKGVDNVKQMGHYNSKTGKRLAIYHGN